MPGTVTVGNKYIAKTVFGSIEGVLNTYSRNTKTFTLKNGIHDGTPFEGTRKYSLRDLLEGEDLTAVEEENVDNVQLRRPVSLSTDGRRLLETRETPRHIKQMKSIDMNKMATCHLVNGSDVVKMDALRQAHCVELSEEQSEEQQLMNRPDCYIVINELSEFYDMLSYVSCYDVIGVAFEAVEMTRDGKLCWVMIGTRRHTFLIDILELGPEVFTKGLQALLENPNIMKVIHDCRGPSDLLYHQFGVNLVNIYDTQVATALLYKQENRFNRACRFVQALSKCLFEYLHLEPEEVFVKRVRVYSEEDVIVWAHRPATTLMLDALAKTVMYLRELRVVLLQKMLQEFTDGVDLFLSIQRDADKEASAEEKKNSNHLPADLFNTRRESDVGRRRSARMHVDDNGYLFNLKRDTPSDPNIVYSNNSPWHVKAHPSTRANQLFFNSSTNRMGGSYGNNGRMYPRSSEESPPGGKPSSRHGVPVGDIRELVWQKGEKSKSPSSDKERIGSDGLETVREHTEKQNNYNTPQMQPTGFPKSVHRYPNRDTIREPAVSNVQRTEIFNHTHDVEAIRNDVTRLSVASHHTTHTQGGVPVSNDTQSNTGSISSQPQPRPPMGRGILKDYYTDKRPSRHYSTDGYGSLMSSESGSS